MKYIFSYKGILFIVFALSFLLVLNNNKVFSADSCLCYWHMPADNTECAWQGGECKSLNPTKYSVDGEMGGHGCNPGVCYGTEQIDHFGCYSDDVGNCVKKPDGKTAIGCCESEGDPPGCTDTCEEAEDLDSPWILGDEPTFIPACRTTTVGSGQDEECNDCDDEKKWHLPDTSNPCKPPAPEKIYLCVGGTSAVSGGSTCIPLSENLLSPTRIKTPPAGTPIYFLVDQVSTSDYTCSDGTANNAREIGYAISFNNRYTNPVWDPAIDPYDTNDTTWDPIYYTNNMSGNLSFVDGAVYDVTGMTSATNRCTNNKQYSNDHSDPSKRYVQGFFKFDYTPQVISVTPASGYSGTWADDTDPDISCNDQNPRQFTAVFRDLDGCSDITVANLWFSQLAPSYTRINESVSTKLTKGSEIRIIAKSNSSGSCSGIRASMQVVVNGSIVANFFNIDTNYNAYTYVSQLPINPSSVRIVFPNDCYFGSGNDTNLSIDKIYFDGILTETESVNSYKCGLTYAGEGFYCSGDYIQLSGNTSRTSGWKYYGSKCFNSGGMDCSTNLAYQDAVPLQGLSLSNSAICSPTSYNSTANSQFTCDPNNSSTTANGAITVNSVSCSGNDLTVVYNANFYSNSYGSNLNINAAAYDLALGNSGWVDAGDRILDFTPPAINGSLTVVSKERFNYVWSANDPLSGILRTDGFPGLLGSTYPELTKSITDETTPKSVSLPTATDGYSTTAMFSLSSPDPQRIGRTDVINIGTIEEGTVGVQLRSVDNVCNMRKEPAGSGNVGSPWFTTKGGHVYSGGSISNPVVDYGLISDLLPRSASPWTYPYSIQKDQTQISTNMLMTSDISINKVISRIIFGNAYDPQTLKNYTFNVMDYNQLVVKLNNNNNEEVQFINSYPSASISSNISTTCNDGSKQYCQITRVGDLTVNSNFVCDKGALIRATGNITLNTPITVGASPSNGCIFMADGDININEGTYLSGGGDPEYDKLQAFLIAQNHINLDKVDILQITADGIKIDGGLIAYGGNSSDPSINWRRSLQLLNNLEYPSFAVSSDYRYYRLSVKFLGGNDYTYVKEIGYKPY